MGDQGMHRCSTILFQHPSRHDKRGASVNHVIYENCDLARNFERKQSRETNCNALSFTTPTRSSILSGASSDLLSRFLWMRAKSRPILSAIAVTLFADDIVITLSSIQSYLPLGTACVRADDNSILPICDLPFDIRDHQGFRPQIIHRDIEKSLDLASMQIHCDNVVAARDNEHVSDEFSGDRSTGFLFLVHSRIWETRDDSCNPPGGRSSARGDKDEKLHEVIVDVSTSRLDDEDILISNRLANRDVNLSIGEVLDCARKQRHAEPMGCQSSPVGGLVSQHMKS